MSEEIKKIWDKSEILAVKAWYESAKGFEQIDRENKFSSGTLFKIVNTIQDYKGTRCSIGKLLRKELRLIDVSLPPVIKTIPNRKKKMHKKPSLYTSTPSGNHRWVPEEYIGLYTNVNNYTNTKHSRLFRTTQSL